jgi:photosystem II stability/assembly factor-like uncharacterized protein
VAVGAAGLIISSDDGGVSWRQAEVPVSATLTDVVFPTPDKGWAVGHAGVILHTPDGGDSWVLQFDGRQANEAFLGFAAEQRASLEAELKALDATSSDAVARDELEYALEDAIFLEEDAQLAVETGPVDPFLAVDFIDERHGIAAGAYGMLYRTDDGGQSWRISIAAIDNPDRFHYYDIHATASGEVYLAGEAGLLYRSVDGGASFTRYYDVYDGSLFGVMPLDSSVLAFGLRGNLFRYSADSDSWDPLATANETSLYGGAALADGSMLLLGSGGALQRLEPGGDAQRYQHPSRSTFSSALETSAGDILLVGMDGLTRFAEAQAQ